MWESCQNVKRFEHLTKLDVVIVKQYLVINLTEVIMRDFKGKYEIT